MAPSGTDTQEQLRNAAHVEETSEIIWSAKSDICEFKQALNPTFDCDRYALACCSSHGPRHDLDAGSHTLDVRHKPFSALHE